MHVTALALNAEQEVTQPRDVRKNARVVHLQSNHISKQRVQLEITTDNHSSSHQED